MTATIVNGAPMTVFYGTRDSSTRELVPVPEVRPTHCPLVWGYMEKGPLTPQMVVGDSRTQMYGANSFDMRGIYATHQTELTNVLNAAGNSHMILRVKPEDAPGPATLRLWADVLKGPVPVYELNDDGSYKLDETGQPIPTGETIEGHQVKYVVTRAIDAQGEDNFGTAATLAGDQTGGGVQSQRYPLLDFEVSSFGAYGNNLGIRVYSANVNSASPLDDRLVHREMVYPFRMACVSRPDALTTPKNVTTQRGETFLNVCWKEGFVNPYNNRDYYVGDAFIQEYKSDADAAGNPPVYGPFGRMAIYQNYVDALLTQFYEAELPYADGFSDLKGEDDELYRFNMIGGVNSNGTPYHSFLIVKDVANGAVVLSENAAFMAAGGGNGTMNNEEFAKLVAESAAQFADANSYLINSAKYPISHVYDTGFPLETKRALASVIAVRKDTFVNLSTYDVDGVEMTAADESSLGVALKTMLQLYPESDYFGTSTMRGMVTTQYGNKLNTTYRGKLPLTLQVAYRSAAYMGAGNRVWDGTARFDRYPGNIVNQFKNVNETYTPARVRNQDWDNGIVRALDYDRASVQMPALKTVYDNDTSVLNSYFTVCAIIELQKVGEQVWREIVGSSDLTEAEVIKFVNERTDQLTAAMGNFDGRYVIRSNAYYTDADRARGYSYTHEIIIYSPNMITVGSLIIDARRISDLDQE